LSVPRILLVNPNTSPGITASLARFAIRHVGDRAGITAVTAPFGAPALATPADLAVAARAVETVIRDEAANDVAIVAAFGDPGLASVRETATMPVLGIGEEGMRAAGAGGRPFAIVTLGRAMREAIEGKAAALGLAGRLRGVRFLRAGVLDIAADPSAIHDRLVSAARDAASAGAGAVLFGGAPFAGIGAAIAARVPVPVVDGVTAALDAALQRCAASKFGAR
jgi:allantoin racemase